MGAPADPRASLAALAGSEPEEAGLIYFDEHQVRWRWHPWRWLEEAVREVEGSGGGAGAGPHPAGAADATVEDAGAPGWPSVEGLVAALARLAGERGATRAAAPPPQLPTGPGRPIAFLAAEPVAAEPAAWLGWALAAGAALVVPAAPELLAWSVAWTRPTHLAMAAAELPELREALLRLEKPRALRRRLRRLRHLMIWGAGAAPDAAEAAAWAELGVPLTAWPAGSNRPAG